MEKRALAWAILTVFGFALLVGCSASSSTALSSAGTGSPEVAPTQLVEPTPTLTPTQPIEPADIIFYNGNVITIEKADPVEQAVAIRGNLIQAVGSDEEVLAFHGSGTVLVDLKGNTLMPGFEEGHIHAFRNTTAEGKPIQPLMDSLLALGWTSVTEMHSLTDFINLMLEAEKNGEIRLRMNIYGEYNCAFLVDGKSIECPSWYLDHDPILDPARMVRVPGVKIFLDGAGGDRGCPYNSFKYPDNIEELWPGIWDTCKYPYGDLYLTEEQLVPVLQDIQDRGYRAAFHIMGDAAIDVALNSIEKVLDGRSNLDVRYQIEHNSALRPDQVERYQSMNMIAMIPGYLNTCEAADLQAMYGEDYYRWYVNRYSLPGLGVHTFSSSDFNAKNEFNPVHLGINPAIQLYGLVARKQLDPSGTVCDTPDWMAEPKISIDRALEMLTIEPAFAVSMENYIGSIKPSKFADLVILSDDPLTMDPDQLYTFTTWMTMVNGKVEYCADGKGEFCPVAKSETVVPTQSAVTPEVQTAVVKYNCDKAGASPAHFSQQDFMLTNIGWVTLTEEQINDFKTALKYSIVVDGNPVRSSVDYSETQKKNSSFAVQVVFDVGYLTPGEHHVQTMLTFDKKIYDGVGWYGPGTQYSEFKGTCTFIIDK